MVACCKSSSLSLSLYLLLSRIYLYGNLATLRIPPSVLCYKDSYFYRSLSWAGGDGNWHAVCREVTYLEFPFVIHHLHVFERFVFGCCFLRPSEPEGLVRKSNFKSDKMLWSYKGGLVARETALKRGNRSYLWIYNWEKKQMLSFWGSLIYLEIYLGSLHAKNGLHFLDHRQSKIIYFIGNLIIAHKLWVKTNSFFSFS